MNLIYYKSEIGNFGDDLNPWLWKQLLGDFSNYPENNNFLAIGSILFDRFIDYNKRNIVFGSGVRDVLFKPKNMSSFDVRFVRGPISSKTFNDAKYITDAAYCLKFLDLKVSYIKKYKTSYVTYFRHNDLINWDLFEKLSGIHVIFSNNDVEFVLKEILQSEEILSTAMHGAIIADIYRIPWKRVRLGKIVGESNFTSELKWYDWFKSIGFDEIDTIDVPINSISKGCIKNKIYQSFNFLSFLEQTKNNNNKYNLSKNGLYNEILDKLNDELVLIKKDLNY